jgi:hypothetical protein
MRSLRGGFDKKTARTLLPLPDKIAICKRTVLQALWKRDCFVGGGILR